MHVEGIERLLRDGMTMGWQGRYDLEDAARAAGYPREALRNSSSLTRWAPHSQP
jgi:hypothetical protein